MELAVKYHAPSSGDSEINLVLLHGWGAGSEIWQPWLPLLRQHGTVTLIDLPGFGASAPGDWADLDGLLNAIAEQLPSDAVLVGFSLGGMLAVQLAARYPDRVKGLVTIASNASYVAREQWPLAMDEATYQGFYQLVAAKPAIALKRFLGLQVKGAEQEKTLLKRLRQLQAEALPDTETLVTALDCLAALDNTQALRILSLPALYLFGGEDVLVPKQAAEQLAGLVQGRVEVIEGAPHAPFISHPEQCWQAIQSLLASLAGERSRPAIDKQQMADSFSRAAGSYDSVAALQRQVGEQLLSLTPSEQRGCLVDLGSGTGYFTEKLVQANPAAEVIAVDIAEGMLRYARERRDIEAQWLCGDAESLPLADSSVDGLFSSLAIQWCENPAQLFRELYRVLKPGGQCWLATLGPETLHELRRAWSTVDDYVHVNQFAERAALEQGWQQAGFELQALEEQALVLEYDSLKELTRELKALGAHNVNSGRPAGLTGRRRMQQFMQGYEAQRNGQGLLPATYQTWWIQLRHP